MEQHEWASKSSSEMATRNHHFHVRVVDRVLDPFCRHHLDSYGLVEQRHRGVLR